MPDISKYDRILDALQTLMVSKNMQTITVSEIAQTAGIGKGSIYYYFSSKEAILEALIERNYKKPLETAKDLAKRMDIPPFTRMAMILQACRNSSIAYRRQDAEPVSISAKEQAYLHHKYINYLISELKPELTAIIEQGIASGEIHFDYPAALAEIVLIVLTIKIGNSLLPSTQENIEETMRALISLLERGTENSEGSLNFLLSF
uniref:HTH tetR-type domain-containing protein n=1 Tax=Eubacterium plexicaudatum ASF492 TaxID=1235802 RepID=N2BFQ2_9FIRM